MTHRTFKSETEIFEQARQDFLVTHDRFIPISQSYDNNFTWCVVDSMLDQIISCGRSFEVAFDQSQYLSNLDKINDLESKKS